MSLLIVLTILGGVADQAETLMAEVGNAPVGSYRVAVDVERSLWIVATEQEWVRVSRISPDGELTVDKVVLSGPGEGIKEVRLMTPAICDGNNSAWLLYGVFDDTSGAPEVFLGRVTAKGDTQRTRPWSRLEHARYFLDFYAQDTLVLARSDLDEVTPGAYIDMYRIAATTRGFNFVWDTLTAKGEPALLNVVNTGQDRDYTQSWLDWQAGWGIRAEIYWYRDLADRGPYRVQMTGLDLADDFDGFGVEDLGSFAWRDYIWRTYEDTPVKHLTFASHQKGGYILAVPDIQDRSLTHLIRLDDQGQPIDPEELRGKGQKKPRKIKRIPDYTKTYVSLEVFGRSGSKADSARILYWAMDEKGRLYQFQKTSVLN